MIKSIADLQQLVRDGETDFRKYGHVRTFVPEDGQPMIGFDYLPEAEFEGTWNVFERMARGLVLDTVSGFVLARPYDKFFNLGQHGSKPTGKIKEVIEKSDGSLGIVYHDLAGNMRVNTRGSFNSEQAIWATNYVRELSSDFFIAHNETLLCEIVYKENRIVVDYNDFEGLIIHGIRENYTGHYLPFDIVHDRFGSVDGVRVAETYDMDDTDAIVHFVNSQKGVEMEGVIIIDELNNRFKIKGEDYLRLHRLVTDITPKRVWELLCAGEYEEYRKQIPDEFLVDFDHYAKDILLQVDQWVTNTLLVYKAWCDINLYQPDATQKEYAMWVQKQESLYRPYLFKYRANPDDSKLFDLYLQNWKKITGYRGA